ncbi:MAG: glycosyltransferase family protein [Methanobrevibacter sp.]|uniref:MJ1255/VC2487 family glycosyltransferase n=1 Tax=Methanobrevibacter sp. TaxID=66852 RepID=UPI0026DEB56F|nr:MJ1255/VC2487 family glycosyltransferase [Methanobrevibacter sp.]MDO5848894.1 glycosyltransferase family protein [Methanobrevibacter sp.]
MILSIVIPTYNEEEYLPVLLDSIKEQNFKDYEVIIADANSTDKTREIAEDYGCVVVDGGMPAVGRNRGAEVAQGEYILFLDSDLKLTDEYLNDLLYEFRMERLGIGITQMTPLSEKTLDKITHTFANIFMMSVESIKPHGAGCYGIIVKKSLHDEFGGFNEELTFGEDTDYIERIAKKERFKVLRKPKIGVSTRRLEEEGLLTVARQYSKSTFNDFIGKRTDAESLNYGFGHSNPSGASRKRLDEIAIESENIIKLKEDFDKRNNDFKKATKRLKNAQYPLKLKIPNRDKKVVFYTVCGEGLGHAIRSGVIIDAIKEKYDVHIFTSERAYSYLSEKFDNVYEIGGFNTVYENNQVSNRKTFYNALKNNPHNLKEGYEILYKKARQLKPNVIVTDFEIYGSMVSKLLKIPLISLDNIHMITQTKIDYPPKHKAALLKSKTIIKGYVIKPKIHILTSFFYPKIKPHKRAVIYPPVLREDILKLKPTVEDHIVVYQTSSNNIKLVNQLKKLDENFIIYGFNTSKKDENLQFREFSEQQLYEDLSTSKAVIANGGFTFISESLYLKKPTFSIPASGNFEQVLNGFYVEKLGFGQYNEGINMKKIKNFLDNLPKYQKRLNEIKKTNNNGIINELIYRIEKYS